MESTPAAPTAYVPVPAGAKCTRHPAKPALFRCGDCGVFTCHTCDFALTPSLHVCPGCMRARNERAARAATVLAASELDVTGAGGEAAVMAMPAPPPPIPSALPTDARCVQHPRVAALAHCDTCGAFMCGTCLFDAGSGMHLCPECAMAPKVRLSKQRQTAMIIGFVLAVVSTAGMVAMLTGVTYPMYVNFPPLLSAVLERLMTFFPALAGVAVSVGAMDKRLGNSPALITAAVWNVIMMIGYIVVLLIAVIGGVA